MGVQLEKDDVLSYPAFVLYSSHLCFSSSLTSCIPREYNLSLCFLCSAHAHSMPIICKVSIMTTLVLLTIRNLLPLSDTGLLSCFSLFLFVSALTHVHARSPPPEPTEYNIEERRAFTGGIKGATKEKIEKDKSDVFFGADVSSKEADPSITSVKVNFFKKFFSSFHFSVALLIVFCCNSVTSPELNIHKNEDVDVKCRLYVAPLAFLTPFSLG